MGGLVMEDWVDERGRRAWSGEGIWGKLGVGEKVRGRRVNGRREEYWGIRVCVWSAVPMVSAFCISGIYRPLRMVCVFTALCDLTATLTTPPFPLLIRSHLLT